MRKPRRLRRIAFISSMPNGSTAPTARAANRMAIHPEPARFRNQAAFCRQVAIPGDHEGHQFEIDDAEQRRNQKRAEIACDLSFDRRRPDQGGEGERRQQLLDRDHGGKG